MAGQKRGLILGLASLAGSTGRIRESKERSQVLAVRQKLADLEARRLQQQMDDAERERKLSELLNDNRASAIMAMPGLSEEQKYALSLGLRANMPFGELSKLIQSKAAPEPTFTRDELRKMRFEEHTRRMREPVGRAAEEPIADKIIRQEAGVREARKRLTDEELLNRMANAPAEESLMSSPVTPGLSAVLRGTSPSPAAVDTTGLGASVSERLRSGMAAAGIPESRINVAVPGSAGVDPKIASAKAQLKAALDHVLAREIPGEGPDVEEQRDKVAQWLLAGNSPKFDALRAYANLPTASNMTALGNELYNLGQKTGQFAGLEYLGVPVTRGFGKEAALGIAP